MTTKGTTTLRLPEERLKVIRAIAGYENRSLVNRSPIFLGNIVRFFTGFFFDYYLINQFLSQILRNLSYGIKEVASLSALRRSFESSRSSINSRILLYSLKLRTIPFLFPFSSVRYFGLADFAMLCIIYLPLLFENIFLKDSIRRICEAMQRSY